MNIVLHEPGIAQNTGNIGRTCVATNTALHMIKPYAFRITEKEVARAGMDYWKNVRLSEYLDFEDFLEKHSEILDERTLPKDGGLADAGDSSEKNDKDLCKIVGQADETTETPKPKLWYATTKAHQCYTDVSFGPDDYIMLGNESRGIPEEILIEHPERCIRIPMWGDIRSLNLANSAAIILYEALRQNGFDKMEKYGELHKLSWKENA